MHTTSTLDLTQLRDLDARAVRDSVTLVRRLTHADLARPTPCSAWTLADLVTHMTVQHRGFAAAARGDGRSPAHWSTGRLGGDPVARYAAAAEDVITAFAAVGTPEHGFELPEISTTRTVPATRAIGFHFIDYVVHGWDVARTLGLPFSPDLALLRAALPIAQAVPNTDDYRLPPDSAFAPALPSTDAANTLDRILTTLGRAPDWGQ